MRIEDAVLALARPLRAKPRSPSPPRGRAATPLGNTHQSQCADQCHGVQVLYPGRLTRKGFLDIA
jgi:hypothetical protein